MTRARGSEFRDQVWVELVDGIVVAKVRGPMSRGVLETCRHQVQEQLARTPSAMVLCDATELHAAAPGCELLDAGRSMHLRKAARGAVALSDANLRRALLLAVSDLCIECRVFTEDLPAAYAWLSASVRRPCIPETPASRA